MILRAATATGLAVGGLLHLAVYLDAGYDAVSEAVIRLGFPVQALVSLVVAAAVLVEASRRTALAAVSVAAGSLAAFAASRSVGLLGFRETGFAPALETPMLLVAEAVALTAGAALVVVPTIASARPVRIQAAVGAGLLTSAVVTLAVIEPPDTGVPSNPSMAATIVVD